MISVPISVKPLARRALLRQFPFDGFAFDISRSWIYPLVTASLRRNSGSTPAKPANPNLVTILLYIPDWDAQHYGYFIPQTLQANISSLLCNLERDNLCRLVCAAHLFAGVSRSAAMHHYLDKFDYDFNEINYPQLKKHYQRHFVHFEPQYLEDLQQLTQAKNIQN